MQPSPYSWQTWLVRQSIFYQNTNNRSNGYFHITAIVKPSKSYIHIKSILFRLNSWVFGPFLTSNVIMHPPKRQNETHQTPSIVENASSHLPFPMQQVKQSLNFSLSFVSSSPSSCHESMFSLVSCSTLFLIRVGSVLLSIPILHLQ